MRREHVEGYNLFVEGYEEKTKIGFHQYIHIYMSAYFDLLLKLFSWKIKIKISFSTVFFSCKVCDICLWLFNRFYTLTLAYTKAKRIVLCNPTYSVCNIYSVLQMKHTLYTCSIKLLVYITLSASRIELFLYMDSPFITTAILLLLFFLGCSFIFFI